MAKTRNFKGKSCRYYVDGMIWVPDDGTLAGTLKNGNMVNLPIKQDFLGKFVYNSWSQRISIGKAVVTCFCPPYPKDGQYYMVNYKDGDKYNCNKSNLEWIPYHYEHTTQSQVDIYIRGTLYTICENGTILQGKQQEDILDYDFDPDLNLVVAVDPFVAVKNPHGINRDHMPVDKFMQWAGYVQGDDAILVDSVILHKDYDWKNFSSQNL